jgi:hypothetical protein
MNHAQAAAGSVEERALVVFVPCHGDPPIVCLEEQTSREAGPAQFPRFDDVDDMRFSRYGPVLAARSRVPALVPGMKRKAQSRHTGIFSGTARIRKAGRGI